MVEVRVPAAPAAGDRRRTQEVGGESPMVAGHQTPGSPLLGTGIFAGVEGLEQLASLSEQLGPLLDTPAEADANVLDFVQKVVTSGKSQVSTVMSALSEATALITRQLATEVESCRDQLLRDITQTASLEQDLSDASVAIKGTTTAIMGLKSRTSEVHRLQRRLTEARNVTTTLHLARKVLSWLQEGSFLSSQITKMPDSIDLGNHRDVELLLGLQRQLEESPFIEKITPLAPRTRVVRQAYAKITGSSRQLLMQSVDRRAVMPPTSTLRGAIRATMLLQQYQTMYQEAVDKAEADLAAAFATSNRPSVPIAASWKSQESKLADQESQIRAHQAQCFCEAVEETYKRFLMVDAAVFQVNVERQEGFSLLAAGLLERAKRLLDQQCSQWLLFIRQSDSTDFIPPCMSHAQRLDMHLVEATKSMMLTSIKELRTQLGDLLAAPPSKSLFVDSFSVCKQEYLVILHRLVSSPLDLLLPLQPPGVSLAFPPSLPTNSDVKQFIGLLTSQMSVLSNSPLREEGSAYILESLNTFQQRLIAEIDPRAETIPLIIVNPATNTKMVIPEDHRQAPSPIFLRTARVVELCLAVSYQIEINEILPDESEAFHLRARRVLRKWLQSLLDAVRLILLSSLQIGQLSEAMQEVADVIVYVNRYYCSKIALGRWTTEGEIWASAVLSRSLSILPLFPRGREVPHAIIMLETALAGLPGNASQKSNSRLLQQQIQQLRSLRKLFQTPVEENPESTTAFWKLDLPAEVAATQLLMRLPREVLLPIASQFAADQNLDEASHAKLFCAALQFDSPGAVADLIDIVIRRAGTFHDSRDNIVELSDLYRERCRALAANIKDSSLLAAQNIHRCVIDLL